ncbi:MAG: UDP-N-acetylmuramoyl-L-alanine--D-glutamate ligase [Deltaproteobacteria bacterium]|nr:UDP-N-acetylmuramoyl-L-alanine--D-glutamate ligase [Deltaproteobacteria bacterium]
MNVIILGLGKTGISLAKYFYSQGAQVWGVDDSSPEPDQIQNKEWKLCTHQLFLGGDLPDLTKVERFFISPGVDPKHPLVQAALEKNLKIEGELDLAYELMCQNEAAQLIAITGTNGKSTTTSLIGEMLKNAGLKTGVGGNLGTPFLDLVLDVQNFEYFVVEVSSFQLESIQKFRPHVAVLLNVTDDHLDRYDNFVQYQMAKANVFAFQTEKDFAVYNDDDLHVLELVQDIAAKKVPCSTTKKVKGAYTDEKEFFWAPEGEIISRFDLSQRKLLGLHNLENIGAAIAVCKTLQIADEAIQQAIDQYAGLPHRLEHVARVNGLDYYDDSKATNVGALAMSLASFDQPLILIAGGKDKGGDFKSLAPLMRAKVALLIVMGEAKERMMRELEGVVPMEVVESMEAAVELAAQNSSGSSAVLLSPACSSFDMFDNYAQRGEVFKACVRRILKNYEG